MTVYEKAAERLSLIQSATSVAILMELSKRDRSTEWLAKRLGLSIASIQHTRALLHVGGLIDMVRGGVGVKHRITDEGRRMVALISPLCGVHKAKTRRAA